MELSDWILVIAIAFTLLLIFSPSCGKEKYVACNTAGTNQICQRKYFDDGF